MNFGVTTLRPARVLLADPPWKFSDGLPGKGRGAAKHYSCLTGKQLESMRLPPLADDCLLLMWRVAAMQRAALDLMDAWGFTLKSEIVWVKLTRGSKRKPHSKRKLHFGMGRYTRASHETCLVGVRGKVKVRSRSERDVFEAPVGKHSEKPDEIYRIAQRLSPGPYTELFGRRPRPGWQVLGNDSSLLWTAEVA